MKSQDAEVESPKNQRQKLKLPGNQQRPTTAKQQSWKLALKVESEAETLYNNSLLKRIELEKSREFDLHPNHKRIGETVVIDNPHQGDQIKLDHSKVNVEVLKAKCGLDPSVEEIQLLKPEPESRAAPHQSAEMVIEVGPDTPNDEKENTSQ